MASWLSRKLAQRPSLFLILTLKSGRHRFFLPLPLFVITDLINAVITLAAVGLRFIPRSMRRFDWSGGELVFSSKTVWNLRHAWEALIHHGSWTMVDIQDARGNVVKIKFY